MKLFLIGHRGVGKSSLLRRMNVYFDQKYAVYDLDWEVQRVEGKDTFYIFKEKGEDYFRQKELEVFHELCNRDEDAIIALGAGFRLDRAYFPKGTRCLWVMRDTDKDGRIFVDRPRLEPGLDPIPEYKKRFEEREILFRRFANEFYVMPEGLNDLNEIERTLLSGEVARQGGIITPTGSLVENWDFFARNYSRWNFDAIELRDDLLTDDQLDLALSHIPVEKQLLSFRREEPNTVFEDLARQGVSFDWPMEKGPCPFQKTGWSILSSHSEIEPVESDQFKHYKWSPLVDNWTMLEKGLWWQKQAPETRSFLPRSQNGMWKWVRQYLKGRQKINFIRLNRDGVDDQPTFYQWVATPYACNQFAGVLGSPVGASHTPIEQQDFFLDLGMPVFAIHIEEEMANSALILLHALGGRAFAVTSPLKAWAFQACQSHESIAEELQSCNTLVWQTDSWHGTNTDIDGFQRFMEEVPEPGTIAVWGGGGTLPVIKKIISSAEFFSVRTGRIRGSGLEGGDPQTVIWAAEPSAVFPPENWRPLRVMDLNYRENSQARAYALAKRALYISGESMFLAQAEAQRDFWRGFF